MRFVAADVGLFSPGLLTSRTDIVRKNNIESTREQEKRVLGVQIDTDTKGRKGRVKLSRRMWNAWVVFEIDHIGKRSWTEGEDGHNGSGAYLTAVSGDSEAALPYNL